MDWYTLQSNRFLHIEVMTIWPCLMSGTRWLTPPSLYLALGKSHDPFVFPTPLFIVLWNATTLKVQVCSNISTLKAGSQPTLSQGVGTAWLTTHSTSYCGVMSNGVVTHTSQSTCRKVGHTPPQLCSNSNSLVLIYLYFAYQYMPFHPVYRKTSTLNYCQLLLNQVLLLSAV